MLLPLEIASIVGRLYQNSSAGSALQSMVTSLPLGRLKPRVHSINVVVSLFITNRTADQKIGLGICWIHFADQIPVWIVRTTMNTTTQINRSIIHPRLETLPVDSIS